MPNDFSHERSITVISTILFGVTSFWVVRKISRDRDRKANCGQAFRPNYDVVDKDGNNNASIVSRRCRNATSPATSYLLSFLQGLEYTCTPESLDGFVLLCMAENKLVIDLLSERLLNPSTTVSAFSDPVVYCYNSFLGLPVARQAVAYFLAKRFLHTRNTITSSDQLHLTQQQHHQSPQQHIAGAGVSLEEALLSINPAHIGIGSGAAGILNGKIVQRDTLIVMTLVGSIILHACRIKPDLAYFNSHMNISF